MNSLYFWGFDYPAPLRRRATPRKRKTVKTRYEDLWALPLKKKTIPLKREITPRKNAAALGKKKRGNIEKKRNKEDARKS